MRVVISANLRKWNRVNGGTLLINQRGLEIWNYPFIDPTTGGVIDFSILKKREGIAVCPITKSNKLVMVRQYKQGADDFTLEFPGGIFDEGENDREKTARRELLEETGYQAGFIKIYETTSHLMPRKSPSVEYSAIAFDCEPFSEQNLDNGEGEVEVLEVEQQEFFELIKEGVITSAPTKLAAFTALIHGDLQH